MRKISLNSALAISTLVTGCCANEQLKKPQETPVVAEEHYNQVDASCTVDTGNSCQEVASYQEQKVCDPQEVYDVCAKFSPSYIALRQRQELAKHGLCIDEIDRVGRGIVNGMYVDNGRKPSKYALCLDNGRTKVKSVIEDKEQQVENNNSQEQQEVCPEVNHSAELIEETYKNIISYISTAKHDYPLLSLLKTEFSGFKAVVVSIIKAQSLNDLDTGMIVEKLKKHLGGSLIAPAFTKFPRKFITAIASVQTQGEVVELVRDYSHKIAQYNELLRKLKLQGTSPLVNIKTFSEYYNAQ